ncbi:putative reverse transcriptase domain-containing protein [Tanacetum coccineum]|uniref:Reverse transcriptase domain-containing protein n=1 Tax=Tanacetum coccineum TaxID=301880 RepID=A0ABQ5FVA0_9ASTR
MPLRRMNQNVVEQLMADHVAAAIAEYEINRAKTKGAGLAGGNVGGNARGNAGGNVAPEARGCTYKTFLGCNPLTFNGTKGAVGLSRWFKKLESNFQISKCANEARMEQELWNLTVKGDDIVRYTNRFHELAAMCPSMVTPKYKKIERYVWGLLEKIQGNVTSSKPATTHEAIHMAHNLMDQAIRFKAARSGEANKRKQEAVKAYVAAIAEGKVYVGNLQLCNQYKLHHNGVVKPEIGGNVNFEIKSQFMRELREDTFSENKNDDAHEHVERVLDIVSLFNILGVSHDAFMPRVFPITLTGAAKRWVDRLPPGTVNS